MKRFLISLATLIIPFTASASTPDAVMLNPSNTLTLIGEVNEDMVEKVAKRIPQLSSNTVYVQLISPGGSVLSGKRIIDQLVALQAQGKQVVCVAHLAASMAFVILQSPACPERTVVSGALLMQHQASLRVQGQIYNILSNITATVEELLELEAMQAKRLQLSVEQFKQLTVHDWWLNSGSAALKAKAADKDVVVLCSAELLQRGNREELHFGNITMTVTISDCPYVVKPKIEIKRNVDTPLLDSTLL